MTVTEFYKDHCQSTLKIKSAYNGKILCHSFDPIKHSEIGEREILSIWAEMKASTPTGFGNIAIPIICAYASGRIEYEKDHPNA